jgi:hypothetical protein
MGSNSLSQWIGSRDNHGSTDHFDIIVDKAGGEGGRGGDYLYTAFLPGQANAGAWGIFRVGNNPGPQTPNAACTQPAAQPVVIPRAPAAKDETKRFTRQPVNKDKGPTP